MAGTLSCEGFGFFLSLKVKRLSNQLGSETWPCSFHYFCPSPFCRPKNEWRLPGRVFLVLSALCTIVCLLLDNQRIKACRQVWNLYALPSALVAGGSVLSLHGGEGLLDTGGRIFGCSDYSYALPMPLNLARTVCVPTTLWGCADSAYKRADSADKCRWKCRVQTVVHINDKFVYTA